MAAVLNGREQQREVGARGSIGEKVLRVYKLEFIVLSKPICFFFSKYGNITISIWIVIMKIATKLF